MVDRLRSRTVRRFVLRLLAFIGAGGLRVLPPLVAVSVLAIATPVCAQSPTPEAEARARSLYRQGSAAFNQNDYKAAYDAWSEAWKLKKSYDVAGALAQVEIELGLYREAAEHLDFCVSNFPAKESDERLAQLRVRFQEVKARVTTLRVRVDPHGADISIDGRSVGKSPMSGALYLDPGRHKVVARFGGRSVERVVDASAGVEQNVHLELGQRQRRTASAAAPAPRLPQRDERPREAAHAGGEQRGAYTVGLAIPADHPRPRRNLIPAFVGAGVFAVSAAVGVIYRVRARSEQDDARSFTRRYGESGCTDGSAPASTCARWKDAANAVDRNRDRSTAALAAAGVAAAATALYLFWPDAQNARSAMTAERPLLRSAMNANRARVAPSSALRFSPGLDPARRLLCLTATY